jgi:hypothetical protein
MMTWTDIDTLSRRISALLPEDGLCQGLLTGALMAARQTNNPVRGNLFAAALRELVTHTLHTMAPDLRVEKCAWYKQEPKTKGPTRRQRATYIIQGGLSDKFVRQELGLDPMHEHKRLTNAMDELNKRTHIRAHSAVHKGQDVRRLAATTLEAFLGLFEVAAKCRSLIEDALVDLLDQEIMDRLIGETIDELDELSTHTRVDEHSIDDVKVANLDECAVTYSVTGTVYVELQYGSNSDVRDDIGAINCDSLFYSTTITAPVAAPKSFTPPKISIDNSSFFE